MISKNITTAMKQLAIALLLSTFTIIGANAATSSSIDSETLNMKEESIQMENWMSDLAEWKLTKAVLSEEIEKESEIEIEEWMINPNAESWEIINVVENEKELEVENWMTNLKKW